jgi:hypothetical protein
MSANPRIQFDDVGFAGTSSANKRNGTGSQLRVRNNTAPIRALVRCSAAEAVLGDSEVDISQLYRSPARNSLTTVLKAAGRSRLER